MRVWRFAATMFIFGPILMAGCPIGSLGGLDSSSSTDVIADGSYAGKFNSRTEFRQNGELYSEEPSDGDTGAAFSGGMLLTLSGDTLEEGDVVDLSLGSLDVTRTVHSVDAADWEYQVAFDLDAQWGSIPMAGTEYITYSTNSDGSLAMVDEIDLTSLDSYDGGAWTFHGTSSGTLTPSSGDPGSSPGGFDLLDLKSGQIKRPASSSATARSSPGRCGGPASPLVN